MSEQALDSPLGQTSGHEPSPVVDAVSGGAAMLRELVQRIDAGLVLEQPEVSARAGASAQAEMSAQPLAQAPPAGLGAPMSAAPAAPVESLEGEGVLHVIFELGGSAFAVPAASLAEVEVYEPPMPIPGVPEWLLGIESFRGEVLSITDLAAWLGFSKLVPSKHARTLIIFDPRSPKRPLTGLAVDGVITHQWLPQTAGGEAAAAALGGRLGRFARRIIEIDGRALAELDIDALLTSEEFLDLHD